MAMIPVGYMSKKVVARPVWLKAAGVEDVYAVSGCISGPFAHYIDWWKHNGFWFFNSPDDIRELCRTHAIDTSGNILFYYEVFEKQFDEQTKAWRPFTPEAAFPTRVEQPSHPLLAGYDLTTFSVGTSPECSPLSCNSMATELPVNRHCLFDTFEAAAAALESGRFAGCEPGPFRIFAVYTVET
jgi:hypothetical protein